MCVQFKWRLFTTHLGATNPPSGVIHFPFSIRFLHPFIFSLLCSSFAPPFIPLLYSHALLLILVFTLLSSPCIHLIPQAIIIFTIFGFFSLPSRSELSHLLNHLVKFMSGDNLVRVSHHNY